MKQTDNKTKHPYSSSKNGIFPSSKEFQHIKWMKFKRCLLNSKSSNMVLGIKVNILIKVLKIFWYNRIHFPSKWQFCVRFFFWLNLKLEINCVIVYEPFESGDINTEIVFLNAFREPLQMKSINWWVL